VIHLPDRAHEANGDDVFPKGGGQSHRHRHVPQATAFRDRDVPLPLRTLHADLPFLQIHVEPFESHHLAAPKPCVPTH
jgi:hypothetical protein